MTSLCTLRARLAALFHGSRTAIFDEEMETHRAFLADEYLARGMSAGEAHQAAVRELGNKTALREQYRDANGLPLLENFWLDLKYACRTLRRDAAFTASCIATLSIGMGAMIAVLAVMAALLWKPLPYPGPDRLVALREVDPSGGSWPFSEPMLLDVQGRSRSVEVAGAFRRGSWALTGLGSPEAIEGAAVTPSLFELLGMKPLVGKFFDPSTPRAVVVSRTFWENKCGRDPLLAGRAIALDGITYTVSGVVSMAADLLPGVELLIPLLPNAAESRTAHEIEAFARLRPGIPLSSAVAEMKALAAIVAREHRDTGADWSVRAAPLASYILNAEARRMLWMVFVAVGLLWLLACINVAGLQLARSLARHHETGTRRALGASFGRLLSQNLTESLVLAFFGTLGGTLLASYAIALVRHLAAGTFGRVAIISMDWRLVSAAVGCMLAATLLSGLLSMRRAPVLHTREVSTRNTGRDLLTATQVALASILLLGAILFLQSFLRLAAVNPGFDPEKLLAVAVTPSLPIDDSVRRLALLHSVEERLSRLDAVRSVGATSTSPFSGSGTANRFRIEGESGAALYHSAAWRSVTPGFFKTLGLPLERGRLFTDADRDGSSEVVIISASMARQFWPGVDPVGKRLLWGRSQNPKTIVGVVGDLRDLSVDASPVPTMFRPFDQLSRVPLNLVIRTQGDPGLSARAIRLAVWSVDPNAALTFRPLSRAMSDSIMRPRTGFYAVAAFASIAMITAAFGLYSLVTYRVNGRRQEIGIRLALGAQPGSIRLGVQRHSLAIVLSGLAVGLPVAYFISRYIASLLYEAEAFDSLAYASVLVLFATVAFLASYGPARKASRVDPVAALRNE